MSLQRVTIDTSRYKKCRAALIYDDGSHKTVDLGQEGASDYPSHKDRERMIHYLKRHGGVVTFVRDASVIDTSYKEDWGTSGAKNIKVWGQVFFVEPYATRQGY